MQNTKIYISSDHAGFVLKEYLKSEFKEVPWVDLGPTSEDRVDYPDYAAKLCEAMANDESSFGVLICGSGQGMAITANRFKHIRAALCWSEEIAHLARAHNNANVLCLSGRTIDDQLNAKIFNTFIHTEFEGGRHKDRLEKINLNKS